MGFAKINRLLRAEILCALFFLAGCAYLTLTPPFQVPDESGHLLRIYQISQGQLIGEIREGHAGGLIPEALVSDAARFSDLPFHPDNKISYGEYKKRLRGAVRLTPEVRAKTLFASFAPLVLYSPVAYFPQVIAMKIGTFLELDTFQILYLGRGFALVFATFCLFITLNFFSEMLGERLLFWLLLGAPMCVFQLCSLSADVMTDGCAFVCLGAGGALRNKLHPHARLTLFLAASGLSLCKTVYLCLPLVFIVPLWQTVERPIGWRVRQVLLLLSCAIGPAFLWGVLSRRSYVPARGDVGQQIIYAKTHFSAVFSTLVNVQNQGARLLNEYVGTLGWLDASVSSHFNHFFLVSVLFMALLLPQRQTWFENGVTLTAVAGTGFLVILSQFLYWTPVGGLEVEGLQGRYFIPLGLFFFFSIQFFSFRLPQSMKAFMVVFTLILWGVCQYSGLHVILQRYWL